MASEHAVTTLEPPHASVTPSPLSNSVNPSGQRLARHVGYNLLGFGLPMLVAFITMPLLISRLGSERFGLLSIAWLVVGYFNLFDFGIGLATTKIVAEYRAAGRDSDLGLLVWTALAMMISAGVVAGILAILCTPWLVTDAFHVPSQLADEARGMFFVLALAIPLVLAGIGLKAVLEGEFRFDLVNAIKIPTSIAVFVGPLIVAFFTVNLVTIAIVLAASRVILLGAYIMLGVHRFGYLRKPQFPRLRAAAELIRFGGWITVSNVISPVLVYVDRLVLGALVTLQALTFYVTPYEMVTRLSVIAASLTGVLFPAFSASCRHHPEQVGRLYYSSSRYLLAVLLPIVTILIGFSQPILRWWVGDAFVISSTIIMQLLAFGVLVNSLARIPYGVIQASNRPDITARVHMIELPVYLLVLWLAVSRWGINGAALAWTIRVTVDYIALEVLSRRFNGLSAHGSGLRLYHYHTAALVSVALLIMGNLLLPTVRLPLAIASAILTVTIAWKLFLTADERREALQFLRTSGRNLRLGKAESK